MLSYVGDGVGREANHLALMPSVGCGSIGEHNDVMPIHLSSPAAVAEDVGQI